ncbi:MAG: metal ABC transporter permease [Gammaproteobacteria bacterium]|nr:metal ABC transporter permease [Gammaproteobacteria bacterium]NNJ95601.1 metal ABC transporter permease [Gammaproteobacteria bacterium]
MSLEGLDAGILAPAFVAGLIVLSTHIPLGYEVLKRGIIFIDIAVAQIAGLGVIIAYTLGWDEHGLAAQLAAVISALLGAWLLGRLETRYGRHQEALIGTSFILAATGGILLLANNPHGGEHLKELLVGQILWVEWRQLLYAAIISLAVLIVWIRYRARIGSLGFYLLFAIAITVSVQLVGVYLVFASLIVPALASTGYSVRSGLGLSVIIGITGYATGLILSALLDLPSGAVIVWTIVIAALLLKLAIPKKMG